MSIENAKELDSCLCCGSQQLDMTLDLGIQPLANSYLTDPNDPESTFPLVLNRCKDCSHLQLSHAVNPDLLFKNYLYVSGTSQTLRDYFDWFAKFTVEKFKTIYSNYPVSVLDIACNDGSQLNSFKSLGLNTYGIDPAINLHELSSQNHEVICDYFTKQYVDHYSSKGLNIITAQNVFAHNSYPVDFLMYCRSIMSDNSLLFIQTSQADMVKNNEFDTIYHEHLSFFNANSMQKLANRAELHLVDIQKSSIHGTSYIFVFSIYPQSGNTQQVLEQESAAGLQDTQTYIEYAKKCRKVVEDLKDTIVAYRSEGYKIIGYGAAAKGMTLLNYGHLSLDFIVDDNPLKQGLYTPGMHIPIVSSNSLKELDPMTNVVFVPLAWNFFDEIRGKIKSIRNVDGDVFVRYFPQINIG